MKYHAQWEASLFALIRRTSVDLPSDVEQALRRAYKAEKKASRARWVLETILENVQKARDNDAPLCQDTGSLIFYFQVPVGLHGWRWPAPRGWGISGKTRLIP